MFIQRGAVLFMVVLVPTIITRALPPNPMATINAQSVEIQPTTSTPTLPEVMANYDADDEEITSLMAFLEQIMPTVFPEFPLSTFEPTDLFIDDTWELVGSVGNCLWSIGLQVSDGQFVITIIGEGGMLCQEISEPVSQSLYVYEPVDPELQYYGGHRVVRLVYLVCKCDDPDGGSCTDDKCDDNTTCPDKNGTSCAWTSPAIF